MTAQPTFTEWLGRGVKSPKKRTRLKPMSAKRSKDMQVYRGVRAKFLAEFPLCEAGEKWGAHFTGCTKVATEIHHQRRRGPHLCDTRYFVPICAPCHRYLETHANLSRALGLLK